MIVEGFHIHEGGTPGLRREQCPQEPDKVTLFGVPLVEGARLFVWYGGDFWRHAALVTPDGIVRQCQVVKVKPYEPERPIYWVGGIPYAYPQKGVHTRVPYGWPWGDMWINEGVFVYTHEGDTWKQLFNEEVPEAVKNSKNHVFFPPLDGCV